MADIILNRATYIEFPDNPEIDTTRVRIEQGSLLLEEILCDGNIVFGETNATRFEATVYNLVDVSRLKIRAYQTDTAGNNRTNLFEGYVDSCKQDKDGYYRKLVAYDALYSIGNANVAGWWIQFWSSRKTATLKALRTSLCDWVGIKYDNSVTLYNDDFECSKTATLSSVSFNTMLFWICEIQCTIPHINRDGILQFISLTTGVLKDISATYERSSSEFEGFITAAIDAVELYDYDNALVATTNTTGAIPTKNAYIIKDNSLLFSLVDTKEGTPATDFVQSYLAQISQIRYTPMRANMIVSDLDLLLGDYVKVENVTSIILQNTLSGSLLVEQEIASAGNEYREDSSRASTAEYLSIEKKTDQMKDEIITDDLLNYAYTNDVEYVIDNGITPVIELSIDMPNTSNFVFLATINLESYHTETREVVESVILGDTPCEMRRTENVPVIVEGYFEWNGAQILSNKPTETYSEDGKHLLNLMFFSIGGRQAGNVSTFKIFLRSYHGRIHIGVNQINATIISKGSSAGNLPWDGTIRIDETISSIKVNMPRAVMNNFYESLDNREDIPTTSGITDTIGRITPQFNIVSIIGLEDSAESSTTT